MTRSFLAAVLAGGASRRMGQPKATMPLEGRPMAAHAVGALRAAGAAHVVLVGGEATWAAEVGAAHLPDRWPGEGPLGGLATAVDHARADQVVVVTACDQPDLQPALLARLVEALDAAPAGRGCAAPHALGGAAEVLPSAWRAACGPDLVELVDGGARRARSAFDVATPVLVEASPADLVDIDDPGDLARRLARPADSEAAVDVPEIDIDEAAAKRGEGTPVFDVREPDEYVDGHVPGATLVPLATVPDHVSAFPAQGEALIVCRSGARSKKAAEFLRTQGIDAINVAGGTLAWIDAGHEVATGDEPGA